MEMLAARLYGKNDMRVGYAPVPDIGRNELLIRVKAAAVCGTDLRMLNNGTPCADESHPLICSHEFSGVVEETGAGRGSRVDGGTGSRIDGGRRSRIGAGRG